MDRNAIGLIETVGLVSMIAALDEILKSANVIFVGCQNIDGLFSASIAGDVSSVKFAIDVGTRKAQQVGEVVASRVMSAIEDEVSNKMPIISDISVSPQLQASGNGWEQKLIGKGS